MDDSELLRLYLADRSGTAFGSLAAKYVDLVYSAARRQTNGDHHRAQEVTQMVFISLARKAASLARHPALAAWLYRSTRLAAADLCRRESRRRRHEDSFALEAATSAADETAWEWQALAPVLDDAMHDLAGRDREALVLRYFANQPFAEMGRRLSLTENAARMRVDRALERLRHGLAARGITSSAAGLSIMLANEAIAAAPPGVAAIAVATGAAAGVGSVAGGAFLSMTANKLAVGVLSAAMAAATVTIAVQQRSSRQLAAQMTATGDSSSGLARAEQDNKDLTAAIAEANGLSAASREAAPLYAKTKALEKDMDDLKARITASHQRSERPITTTAYNPGALDVLPRSTFQARPTYPPTMRAQGMSGQATVDFIIDDQGNVRNATIANSTNPEFEQPSIDAVSQWTFSPGQKGGSSVNTHMQVPIVYALNTDPDNANALTVSDAEVSPSGTTTFSGNVQMYVATTPAGQQAKPYTPSGWFPGPKG